MTAPTRAAVSGPTVVCLVEADPRQPGILSAASRMALDEAAAMAGERGRLHAVCVLPALQRELVFSAGELARLLDEQPRIVARTQRWLDARVRSQVTGPLSVSAHVLAGAAAVEVSALARDVAADLIVVPADWSRGNRLTRLVSPSAFDRLVRLAPCPVIAAGQAAGRAPAGTADDSAAVAAGR